MSKSKVVGLQFIVTFIFSIGILFIIAPHAFAITNANLAVGKTVTSSSTLETGGYGAAKLVDGIKNYPNYSTSIGYSSTSNPSVNHTEWVTIDLGATTLVGEVDLYPIDNLGTSFPITFTVDASTDNINWATEMTQTNLPNPGALPQKISFDKGSVYARYIRINATSLQYLTGAGYYMQFSEMEVFSYSTVNPTDLAYNKTVTTSSSIENWGWSATNLVDGIGGISADPGWTSSFSNTDVNHTEWAEVDLGYQYPLSEIRLDSGYSDNGFPIDFTVQVSPDNSTWTTVATRVGFPNPGYVSPDFQFSSISARYVKVTGTNLPNISGFGYGMRLSEISVYSDQQDLAINKIVTASSTYEINGFSVANVVDGVTVSNATTEGWSSRTGVNQTEWVDIDLGQSYGVGEVDLYPISGGTGQGFPIDFTIQTSLNNTTWTTVVTKTGYPSPGGTMQPFTFPNKNARYIRVQGTNLWKSSNGYYFMQFAEVGVSRNTTYNNTSTVDYTMEDVTTSSAPVITKTNAGSSGNANGYETGHVIQLADSTYRMVATEMWSATNAWVPARIGLWKSTDGTSWTREYTLVTGNNITGDPHNYTWDPTFYYNTTEGKWNIIYRGNATVFRFSSNVSGTTGIDGPYTESTNTLSPIIGNRKYWQSQSTFVSFSNIWTVGSKLYAFIGDAATTWGNGIVTADSITGPWTADNSTNIENLSFAENPIVTQLADGTYVAVFDEINNGAHQMGFAYSIDGLHWVQKDYVVQAPWVDTNGPVNSLRTPLSIIPNSDGTFTVYFTGYHASDSYFEIGKVNVLINKFTKGKSISTSSTYSSAWTAANLVDSNNSTAWSSVLQPTSTGTEWISIDKGQNQTINGVSVYPRTSGGTAYAFPVDFKFQSSTDGQIWTDISGQTYTSYPAPTNSNQVFTFSSSINARYVRMYITKFSTDEVGSYYAQAAEFKIRSSNRNQTQNSDNMEQ